MANPMFNTPDAVDPQMQGPQMMPAGVMMAPGQMQPPPQQQPNFMNPKNLSELYGIMAGGARNPQSVGQGYVDAMQTQQGLDTADQPFEQYLRLYGNINPYDFEQESLADFHDTLVETGDMAQAFRKLKRVEKLSSTEDQILKEASTEYQQAERSTAQMMGLAQRFEQANAQGIRTGAPGRLEDWFIKFAGNERDFQLLRQEFDQIRNMEVIGALPKGPASDKDIAIAQKGWPPATADAAYIAAFLRGMSKMKAIVQAQALHKADYIGRNKTQAGLLSDWTNDKEYWMLKALGNYGGVYNPLNPDGTEMTAEQAMRARYGDTTRVGAGPDTTQPQVSPDQQAAQSAAEVKANVESVLEKYRRLNKERGAFGGGN